MIFWNDRVTLLRGLPCRVMFWQGNPVDYPAYYPALLPCPKAALGLGFERVG